MPSVIINNYIEWVGELLYFYDNEMIAEAFAGEIEKALNDQFMGLPDNMIIAIHADVYGKIAQYDLNANRGWVNHIAGLALREFIPISQQEAIQAIENSGAAFHFDHKTKTVTFTGAHQC